MNSLVTFFFFALLFLGAGFGIYKLIGTGEFIDWLVGSLSFIWMIFVVIIPWNAYFKAREILFETEISQLKNIQFSNEGLEFAKKVANRALIISISLHVLSALALLSVAHFQISQVGYYSAVLVLLLTFLRPGVRFYEYLSKKLETIRQEIRYPREDIENLKEKVEFSYNALNTNKEGSSSWRLEVDQNLQNIQKKLEELEKKIIELKTNLGERELKLEKELNRELEAIRKESQESITKLIEQGEVAQSLTILAKYLKKL